MKTSPMYSTFMRLKEVWTLLKDEMINIVNKDSLIFAEAVFVLFTMVFASILISYFVVFVMKKIQNISKNGIIADIIKAGYKPIVAYIILNFSIKGIIIVNKGFNKSIIKITDKNLINIATIMNIAIFTTFVVLASRSIEKGLFERKFYGNNGMRSILRVGFVLFEIIISIISIINMFIILGFDIKATLTFGGLSSVALGFAAKDLMSNFFGTIMIYLDKPYMIGDDVSLPGYSIVGTIEKISWRLTTIRQYNKVPIYVPNSLFTSISVENRSRRTHRLFDDTIKIRYNRIHNIKDIASSIRNILDQDNAIDSTQNPMACVSYIGNNIFEIQIYCLMHTVNFVDMNEAKQFIFIKIQKELSEKYSTYMIFPKSIVSFYDDKQEHYIKRTKEKHPIIEQ